MEKVAMFANVRQALLTGGRSLATLKDAVQGHRRSMAARAKAWFVSGNTTALEVQKLLGIEFWAELAKERGKQPGSPNVELSTEGQADRRRKALLLSNDAALATRLNAALTYGIGMPSWQPMPWQPQSTACCREFIDDARSDRNG